MALIPKARAGIAALTFVVGERRRGITANEQ
jgi:hypothetical protein